MDPDVVVDLDVDSLRRSAVEEGEGFGADLAIEEQEGRDNWLCEVNMRLQLSRMRGLDPSVGSYGPRRCSRS